MKRRLLKSLWVVLAALLMPNSIWAADPDLENDFTLVKSVTWGDGVNIAGSGSCSHTAWDTGNARQQALTILTAPEDAAGWIAMQAWTDGSGKGWWNRSDNSLYCVNAQRSACVFGDDLTTGWLVVFECKSNATSGLTLTNGNGEPDGTFSYVASEDGKKYFCTITAAENAYVGFCGIKNSQGILKISVYKPNKVAVATTYTVKYVDADGKSLKDSVTYDAIAGATATLSDADKANITVGEQTYLYDSDDSADKTIAADSSTVITAKFRAAETFAYTVNEVCGGTNARVTNASSYETANIKIGYRKYNAVEGQLYKKDATSKEYNYSFKLTQNNQVEDIAYTAVDGVTNVVFCAEGEDIEGLTPIKEGNTTIRSSNSASAYASADTKITTLAPGKYKIHAIIYDNASKPNSNWAFKAGEKEIANFNCTNVNIQEFDSEEFAVASETDLIMAAAGGTARGLDAIYIVKTGELVVDTFNFADPAFRENIGDAMADVKGFIYNETFTVGETTLQITGGSAPSRIYKDANRGQCLVTYKEYTTLTFRAPEGKAIAQIKFTAAGNSNINNFTASSDSIKGMIWMGNADGVRFAQGGTSYLANAIVTLIDKNDDTKTLPEIEYAECANIAAFNALEAGSYAKVTLTDAEVIGKSADGYSTVWMQDATGGCWIQYTTLNDSLKESTKVNGTVYVVKRFTSGNPQMKEAEATLKSELTATAINEYSIVKGDSIKQINVAANLNKVVKIVADSLKMTSATEGTLYVGQESIAMNNGGETANQQLHKIAGWKKDSVLVNVEVTAILSAKSATANQLLPVAIEQLKEPVTFNYAANPQNWPTSADITDYETGKVTELTVDGVKLVAIQNNEFVGNILYKAADADTTIFRVGKQNAFKLIAPEGKALVSVNVTMAAATFDFEASTGAVADNVWTGNATEVTFTTTLNRQILKIEVMLADENEETVKPATAVEVADIAAFNALEAGKLAKLTLNDARVNAVNGGKYYVEDATGAMVIKGVELSAGKALNGYIVGVKSNEEQRDFVADVVAAIEYQLTADDASTLNVTDTTLVGTVMTFAEAGVQANYGRLITFENVSVSGSGNNKTLTDAAGNTFKARDWMGVLPADYTWPEKVSSITGVVVFNSTAWFLMPISDEAIVAAQTTGIRNINAADRNVVIYNLQGVRQDRAKKGLNIINGKKVVIK